MIWSYRFFSPSPDTAPYEILELPLINISILIKNIYTKVSEQHRKLHEIKTIYHCRKYGLHKSIEKQKKKNVRFALTIAIIEQGHKKEWTQYRFCRHINFAYLTYVVISFDSGAFLTFFYLAKSSLFLQIYHFWEAVPYLPRKTLLSFSVMLCVVFFILISWCHN